jgi:hypothetical protein
MDQEKVLCIRTADGQNVPITRVAGLYLNTFEVQPGYIQLNAIIGNRDDTAFCMFDKNEIKKGVMRWKDDIYGDIEMNIVTIVYFNCTKDLEEYLGKEDFEKYMAQDEGLKEKADSYMFELAAPVVRRYADNIYSHLPVVPDVIELEGVHVV